MAAAEPASVTGRIRFMALLVIIAGIILAVAGAGTWVVVQQQLSDERITVAEDADYFAGRQVQDPLTAYSQADIINKHALDASGGKTYAELERDDPVRDTMMNASFLRASLFTSVVAFGIAAMAMGLGLIFILIGAALMSTARGLSVAAPDEYARLD